MMISLNFTVGLHRSDVMTVKLLLLYFSFYEDVFCFYCLYSLIMKMWLTSYACPRFYEDMHPKANDSRLWESPKEMDIV